MNGQHQQQQEYQQDPTAFEDIDEPPPEASFAINGTSISIATHARKNRHGI
jgi:hypothetical protein